MGKLLDALSVPPDHASLPVPPCALSKRQLCCGGLGYVLKPHGPFVHANLCECVKRCPKCMGAAHECQDRAYTLAREEYPALSPLLFCSLLNEAELPARYESATIKKFSNHSGNVPQVLQGLQSWLHTLKHTNEPKGAIISGPVGVGKTYLLVALAKELIFQGLRIKFVDFFQLISKIKASFNSPKASLSLLDPLLKADVLLIDELGKGRSTDFEATILDQLIMGRYNEKKLILATTNCTLGPYAAPLPGHLTNADDKGSGGTTIERGLFEPETAESLEKRIGRRIYSRLLETTLPYELHGLDFRKTHSLWHASSPKPPT